MRLSWTDMLVTIHFTDTLYINTIDCIHDLLYLFQGQQIERLKTEIDVIRTKLIVDYANYIGVS